MCSVSCGPSLVITPSRREFDSNKPFTFTGPVTKVEWMNPHTFFYVDVIDEQTKAVTNWAMEMGSPNVSDAPGMVAEHAEGG